MIDGAIPLLGIYSKKSRYNKDISTLMFITALFKLWKQPGCPTTNEWIKKTHIHTHTHIHTQCIYVYMYIYIYTHILTHTQWGFIQP
jgi:hypothetical protein